MAARPMFARAVCSAYILTASPTDLDLNISVDEATPARVAYDHIQALEEVPRDEPGNALTPQVDGFLGTERLRQKLAATKSWYLEIGRAHV